MNSTKMVFPNKFEKSSGKGGCVLKGLSTVATLRSHAFMRLNSVVYCLNSPANDYNSITSDSTNEASLLYKYGISLKEDSLFDDGWRRNPNICCWSCAPFLFFPFFLLSFSFFFFFFFFLFFSFFLSLCSLKELWYCMLWPP